MANRELPHDAVVLLPPNGPWPEHERQVHRYMAACVGQLLGIPFIKHAEAAQRPYFVPARTLVVGDPGLPTGLLSLHDFFGGLVPLPFLATKAVAHAAWPGGPVAPGWQPRCATLAGDALLPGWTVFDSAGAREAAAQLLATGPVRVKPVRATGGRGQTVIENLGQLDAALHDIEQAELESCGLVLETNLTEVTTFSVGQATIGGFTASYYGTQRLVQDSQGQWVYGGSNLSLARGGYEQLLLRPLPATLQTAVDQARRYEQAILACYPGLIASRRNYDAVAGRDTKGRWVSGIMEQSWRVGGASAAELLALLAFQRDPDLTTAKAATFEVYGTASIPSDAVRLYQGNDDELGQLCKYATVDFNGGKQPSR
ncbi:DUF3182 family protein [Pseudomonas typographi]|uniref:DUF3182 family protein n=1 Tax=Pseudomonas typographi TaxID=2715964 RepID=UPI0016897386|nr:DUF3182 family protein [Pseudomonas typographi]MBD1589218.1 DUF3182 family protein [Pseudomonas typographi]